MGGWQTHLVQVQGTRAKARNGRARLGSVWPDEAWNEEWATSRHRGASPLRPQGKEAR